jgi:aminoglycoside/choline kinase family phosphotransferase
MAPTPTDHRFDLSGWSRIDHLKSDASARTYSRLRRSSGETAILVQYPVGLRHQLDRDLEVFNWCRERGLRVPELFGAVLATGQVLLEDLGDSDAEAVLASTRHRDRPGLLESMLGPLELLADCDPDDLPPWNPPLDRTRLRWELAGFELWFVSHRLAQRPWARLGRWLDDLADEVAGHPRRVCHRDYHLNNLLVQDDGSVGVIDVQDILVGPDTYDVVSLTTERAALRLIPQKTGRGLVDMWADRTRARAGWRDRAVAVQVQRGLKVLGTFSRFAAEGRGDYDRWLSELRQHLIGPLETLGADSELTALLLD